MEPIPNSALRNTLRFIGVACAYLLLPLVAASGAVRTDNVKVVYVIPSSHWDLGFLRPPLQEMDVIKPHLDAVIKACHADPQFRWTIESVWQLNAWLQRTKDPAEIKNMADLLRSGQIELSAADGSMHTEFMGSEELNRLIYAAREAGKKFGIDPQVAMMNDVPGFSLRLPQVLARSGVKYLFTGSNISFGGGTSLWPGRMPFYWEGPDGSKVLMWQTQGKNGGYTEGLADYFLDPSATDPYLGTKFYPKSWSGLSSLEIMQRGVSKLLSTYKSAGYSHSTLAVFFMHDGIGPDYELNGLLPAVRAWNASGRKPKLVVGTPAEFFAYLIQHDGTDFPVYRGDWSGLWARVKVNSPGMSADARMLQSRLPQTETLWSLLRAQGIDVAYPHSAIASDYRGLFIYDEHNGAGQAGWPKVMTREQVLQQNLQYSNALRSAVHSENELLNTGLEKLASASGSHQAVIVYNPLSWKSSQIVRLSGLSGYYRVRDAATGSIVISQQLPSGDICFEASDVPSLGYRTYYLESLSQPAAIPVVHDEELHSPFFQVELNAGSGAINRITDLRTHRVIVNPTSGGMVGVLETAPKSAATTAVSGPVKIMHVRGPLFDYIAIDRSGSAWQSTVIALPQDRPEVDLTETLDRSKMPFVPNKQHGIAYSFAFRFSFLGATQRWIDDGKGFYRFPQDLLPGAKNSAVVPRHVIAWSGNTVSGPYHVMLSQKQAFFDSFIPKQSGGYIPAGVNVDVMTKSDQGETKDQGVITFKTFEPGYGTNRNFSFAITGSTGQFDPVAAHHFGMRKQFIAVVLPPGKQPTLPTNTFLSISARNVVVEDLKPSIDGNPKDYMLRLQEISGEPASVKLTLPVPIQSIVETTLTEDRVLRRGISADHISLSPHETLTLRLSTSSRASHSDGD